MSSKSFTLSKNKRFLVDFFFLHLHGFIFVLNKFLSFEPYKRALDVFKENASAIKHMTAACKEDNVRLLQPDLNIKDLQRVSFKLNAFKN